MSLRRITRDSRLSPEEAAENREIRKQVAEELPELIARHEERMAAKTLVAGPAGRVS
jgi:hypothetical protein